MKSRNTVSGCAATCTLHLDYMFIGHEPSLSPLLGLGEFLDLIKAAPPVVLDGSAKGAKGGLVGAVDAAGPLPPLHHEPGGLQDAQVLADR